MRGNSVTLPGDRKSLQVGARCDKRIHCILLPLILVRPSHLTLGACLMTRILSNSVVAALLLFAAFGAASAASLDASTLSCKDLTDKNESTDKTAQYGASVILCWMAGYQATEEQATVVFGEVYERRGRWQVGHPSAGGACA
jgi:hypothetical protein